MMTPKPSRTEVDNKVCSMPNTAEHLKKAWSNGDIKKFAIAARDLQATLNMAQAQLKEDLWNEATR